MADIDIDPFSSHEKTDSHPGETGENIPLTPGGGGGGSSWEPEPEQETSLGGKTHESKISKKNVLKSCTNYYLTKRIKDWNLV